MGVMESEQYTHAAKNLETLAAKLEKPTTQDNPQNNTLLYITGSPIADHCQLFLGQEEPKWKTDKCFTLLRKGSGNKTKSMKAWLLL